MSIKELETKIEKLVQQAEIDDIDHKISLRHKAIDNLKDQIKGLEDKKEKVKQKT